MPLLLLALIAMSVISGQVALRAAERADYQPEHALEARAAIRDVSRYATAYQAYLAANASIPLPSADMIFPAYGFNPITRATGRSTIYAPAGADHMVVCYVPRGADPRTLQAELGPAATVGAAAGCPAPAGAEAAVDALAVFFALGSPGG